MISGCEKDDISIKKPAPGEVWIKNDRYIPCSLTIPKGSTILWTNKDPWSHTVTSNIRGLFDSGQISSGRSFRYKFLEADTIYYYCKNHLGLTSGMSGEIIVAEQ